MSDIVRKLMVVRLNTAGPFPSAFENVPFNPQTGVAYQRLNLLPAQTENPTMGDGFERHVGLLQVTLFYPLNAGPGPAETRARVIRTLFKRGTAMVDGTSRVLIIRSPFNGPAFVLDGSWFALPVSIPYQGDIFV